MATTTKPKEAPATDALTCPECGKTFTRAAALGAHRKMTHGVAGTSKNANGKRTNANASRKRRTNHEQPRSLHNRREQRRRAAGRP